MTYIEGMKPFIRVHYDIFKNYLLTGLHYAIIFTINLQVGTFRFQSVFSEMYWKFDNVDQNFKFKNIFLFILIAKRVLFNNLDLFVER